MPERRSTARSKARVTQRARGCCEYCKSRAEYSPDPFSIEHVVPLSRGGDHNPANLALACQGCNNRKYVSVEAEDPVDGKRVARYHPRLESWSDHFAWSDDLTLVVGLTPTGRATVEKLQLNRLGVVNLRRILGDARLHPPGED